MKALPETSGEESIEMHGMACARCPMFALLLG